MCYRESENKWKIDLKNYKIKNDFFRESRHILWGILEVASSSENKGSFINLK